MKHKLFAMLLCAAMVLTGSQAFAVNAADIVFILDTTGSMQPYIDHVRDELGKFADYLKENKVAANYAVVEYKDVTYDGPTSTKEHSLGGTRWTNNVDTLKSDLAAIKVTGGGDWEETPGDALDKVLAWTDWSSQNVRVVFVLTDAGAKDNPQSRVQKLQNAGIMASVIGRTSDKDEYYKKLYLDTDGVFIDIMTEDWYKAMLDIASYIVEMTEVESDDTPLPYTPIDVVSPDTVDIVANKEGIPSKDINGMTEDNQPFYDTSLPHEIPTASKDAMSNDIEFLTKIDTVVLYAPDKNKGDEGYFLFQFEISDKLVNSADIKALEIGNYNPLNTLASYDKGFVSFAMLDPVSAGRLEHIQKNVLTLIYGKTEDVLVLYLVKDKNDGNKIKLFNSGAVEAYMTENREKTVDSLKKALEDLAKDGKSLADILKEKWDNTEGVGGYTDRVKALIDDIKDSLPDSVQKLADEAQEKAKDLLKKVTGSSDSGGGCDAGFGLIGIIALAGLAFKKRS